MFPNWHGTSYRRILWHYGFRVLWTQFWYDVGYWKRHREDRGQVNGPELKQRLNHFTHKES